MNPFIKLIIIATLLQIKHYAFAQTSSSETSYLITFSPVYASSLVDINSITIDDLYLIVSDKPIKIDSVMSVLSKKKYSLISGVLDTLRQQFKIYEIVKKDSKSKKGSKVNRKLTDCNNYKTGYFFPLNDTIKKTSAIVGYIIRRYTFFEEGISYKILNDKCDEFPNVCRAVIIGL